MQFLCLQVDNGPAEIQALRVLVKFILRAVFISGTYSAGHIFYVTNITPPCNYVKVKATLLQNINDFMINASVCYMQRCYQHLELIYQRHFWIIIFSWKIHLLKKKQYKHQMKMQRWKDVEVLGTKKSFQTRKRKRDSKNFFKVLITRTVTNGN